MPIRQMPTGASEFVAGRSADGAAKRAEGEPPLWLDVTDPSEEDLAWLAEAFGFHPVALDDCRRVDQHSKLSAYDGYLFVSMAMPRGTLTDPSADPEIEVDELQAFLGRSYLITVHHGEFAPLADVPSVFLRGSERGKHGSGLAHQADFLLYLCADAVADAFFPLLDAIDDQVDTLEDQILESPAPNTLHRLFTLKQQLVLLRKLAGPLREVMNALADRSYPEVRQNVSLYFRNVYDHLVRAYEIIEASRDLLGDSLDAYLSTVSNRLNEVMKRLTLITTIFMPMSFIVGFGGMNFVRFIPFDYPWAFALVLALLVATPALMGAWFFSRRWV